MSPTAPSSNPDEKSSSASPRSFGSLEFEVRSDIRHLVKNRLLRGLGSNNHTPASGHTEEEESQTAADELTTLALEFVACVTEEKRCTSHRMRRTLDEPLAPGVTIDTPGASLFFWRFWEAVVDLATACMPHQWIDGKQSLITADDWDALREARFAADSKMDRAIELINMAQHIECVVAAGWSVWSKPGRWADLPLLEPMIQDYQLGLFSAISQHEDILVPRIQGYICGAKLPESYEERMRVRDLLVLRWKWIQLQRFSALLWNTVNRPEYFPHAIRVLDALADFSPLANDETPITRVAVARIRPPTMPHYYDLFEEWSEPPPKRPPTVLQLLLSEGAAVWLTEAMPAIRRYVSDTPLSQSEKSQFDSLDKSRQERDDCWVKWRCGLESVYAWCTDEHNGMPNEATLVTGVQRALHAMTQAESKSKGQACL